MNLCEAVYVLLYDCSGVLFSLELVERSRVESEIGLASAARRSLSLAVHYIRLNDREPELFVPPEVHTIPTDRMLNVLMLPVPGTIMGSQEQRTPPDAGH